jgi:hypothetical protein
MVVLPWARICAVPWVASIAMTLGSLEVHVAVTAEPFAEALNWMLCPWLADRLYVVVEGDIVTLEDVLLHEVPAHTVALPVAAPLVTVIVTEELAAALLLDANVTNPLLFTLTMAGSELVHVVPDAPLMFLVLPSSNTPVAVSCMV